MEVVYDKWAKSKTIKKPNIYEYNTERVSKVFAAISNVDLMIISTNLLMISNSNSTSCNF